MLDNDLRAELLVVVTFRARHSALAVDRECVERALMARLPVEVTELDRLARPRGEIDVDRLELGRLTRKRLPRACEPGDVQRIAAIACRTCAPPFARSFATRGPLDPGDSIETVAIPLVRPLQARQCNQQVDRQHPRARDRMQIPEERAAFQAEIRHQPRLHPTRSRAARPPQIESRRCHEQQQYRAGADDLPPDVAITQLAPHQPPMQRTHVAEERFGVAVVGASSTPV